MTHLLKTIFTTALISIHFSMFSQILWETEAISSFYSGRHMATSEAGEIVLIDWFSMTKLSADGDIILEKELPEQSSYNIFSSFIYNEAIFHLSLDFNNPFLSKYDFDGNLIETIEVVHDEFLGGKVEAIDEENFVGRYNGLFMIYNIYEGVIFTEGATWLEVKDNRVYVGWNDFVYFIDVDSEARTASFSESFSICEGEKIIWLTDNGDVACRQSDAEFGGGDFYSVHNSNGLILQSNRRTVNDLYKIGSTQLSELDFGQLSDDCHYGIQSNVEQVEVFYGDPTERMSSIIFDRPSGYRNITVTPNELGGLNIGIETNNSFRVYKLDTICGTRPPQTVSSSTGQYATFSGGLRGTGVFNCEKMPKFQYSIEGDFKNDDTSVPGQSQVVDNSGGEFEFIFGEADSEQNIEIEVAGYNGNAGDPISKEVYTTLDFEFPVPKDRLGFMIVDVEQDQVEISALDQNGDPVPNFAIFRWYKEAFDADNSDSTILPKWDPVTSTLVGHHAQSRQKQTEYQDELPDDEGGAAWFVVDIPITQLRFTSQALGIAPDDPSMHFFFASNCADEDVSFNFSSRPIIGPLRIGDVYAIDVETCNTGTTDLFNLDIRSSFYDEIEELEAGNTSFDLPSDSCIVSFYGYDIYDELTRSKIYHYYDLYINEREVSSISMSIETDRSPLITEPISDLSYLQIYPWLSGRISEEDCANLEITVFQLNRSKEIALSDGRVFWEDGTLICQSSDSYDCTNPSRYTDDKIINKWNCIDGSQIEIEVPNDSSEPTEPTEQTEPTESTETTYAYPWINNISSNFDCESLIILEYDLGAFSYVYLSDGNTSELYFEDGTFYCADTESRDCRQLYNLSDSQISDRQVCNGNGNGNQNQNENEEENENESDDENEGENESNKPNYIDIYPWIDDVSESFNCGQLTIYEYNLGAFSYVYLSDGNTSQLYFQDGTFYCADRETRDCRALYELRDSDISNRWTCNQNNADNQNGNISESHLFDGKDKHSNWSVRPNPSSGIFIVIHPTDVSEIFVFDITGKLLLQQEVSDYSHTKLNLADLKPGIYLMTMRIGQRTVNEKLVKL